MPRKALDELAKANDAGRQGAERACLDLLLDVRGRLAPPFREAGEGARAKGLTLVEPETEF